MKVDRLEMSLWEDQARRRRLRENLLGGAISALLGVLLVEFFNLFDAGLYAIVAFVVVLVISYVYYRKIVFEAPRDEPTNQSLIRLREKLDPAAFFPALFRLVLRAYTLPEYACVFPSEFAEGRGSVTVRRLVGEKAIECVLDIDLKKAETRILYRHVHARRTCEGLVAEAQTVIGREAEEETSPV